MVHLKQLRILHQIEIKMKLPHHQEIGKNNQNHLMKLQEEILMVVNPIITTITIT